MQDSIFTKIIKGEIPAHIIYQDEQTIAILTIEPVRDGHVLVIPKRQVDQYIDLDDESYLAVWATVKKIAPRIREATQKERVGIVIKGIDVPHFHVHLIPFNAGESLQDGAGALASDDDLARIAEKLRFP